MTEAVTTPSYQLPDAIRDAAKHGELVVFLGAGASILCGSPDWKGFADGVVRVLQAHGALNFLAAEQLRTLGDSRRTLSIAMEIAFEKEIAVDFDAVLHPKTPKAKGMELYKILSALRPVFVTTNYDKWLDDEPQEAPDVAPTEDIPVSMKPSRQKYYLREHFTPEKLSERGAVIHLHGSYTDSKSMVVSLRDYIEHYADEKVKTFLSEMFRHHTVLFVGYGLAELELLEHIVSANNVRSGDTAARHFVLYAHRSSEADQTKFVERFFRTQCGVEVVPYCIDVEGYDELLNVFKAWSPQIDMREPSLVDKLILIDRYVAAETVETNRLAAMGVVRGDFGLVQYLLNTAHDPIWFSEFDAAGFFNPENNPAPRLVTESSGSSYIQADSWAALKYLEQVTSELAGLQAQRAAEIVRSISLYSLERGVDNWRTWWALAGILAKLPLDVLQANDVDMVQTWLAGRVESSTIGRELGGRLLPRLLASTRSEDWQFALRLIYVLTALRPLKAENIEVTAEPSGVLDSHTLGEILKKSAGTFGEKCGIAAVKLFGERLQEVLGSAEEDRHTYVWRSAIEEHDQDEHKEDYRHVLVDALRDASMALVTFEPRHGDEVAAYLLDSQKPTFTRIGIYVCGENYGRMAPIFWSKFNDKWLYELQYWHEIFWLVKKSFGRFTPLERQLFLTSAQAIHGNWRQDADSKRANEMQKRDLLHAAAGQGDPEVDQLYAALIEEWGPVRDHPDFHMYMSSAGWVGERSPISSDDMVTLSPKKLADALLAFKPDSQWGGDTFRGVAQCLTAAVRGSEDGFSDKLALFATMPRAFQHGVLSGLKERWLTDKRDINWAGTLDIVSKIIANPTFKQDLTQESEGWEPNVNWVASDIADLFKAAVATERQIPKQQLLQVIEILDRLIGLVAPSLPSDDSDAVSQSINTPRGRALEALIVVALALKKLEVNSDDGWSKVWDQLSPIFERELATSEVGRNLEFSTLFPLYCSNIHYLSASWMEKNFERIFPPNLAAWRCAAQGFAYQNRLYPWLYGALVKGGHLARMLEDKVLDDKVRDRALQFLGLAYLDGLEGLDDEGGVLALLIKRLSADEISRIAWFFWTMRARELPGDRREKILAFWEAVGNRAQFNRSLDPILFSSLNLLSEFFEDLCDRHVDRWCQAAPFAQAEHHGNVLVENVARLCKSNPMGCFRVFNAALSGFLPDYPPEKVQAFVRTLADSGLQDEAESLCNEYAARGSILLKPTYEELRQRKSS